jgi:anti-sigma factor RsiW
VNEPRSDEPVCRCRDVESVMAAYVDGETAVCDCDRVRAHVETCACCRDRVEAERTAREVVRARRPELRACAPERLKARCAAFARPAPPETAPHIIPHVSFVRRWAPYSVAATLILAVAVVFGFGLTEKSQALAFQTTLDHVKCSRFNAGPTKMDAGDAEHKWEADYGWRIDVPESSANLELRGIKRCGVIDGSVAHLMYSWMGQPLSVYVLPKRTLDASATHVERFKHHSIMWSQNDRTYILVTAHPPDPALDAVIAYVRSTAY